MTTEQAIDLTVLLKGLMTRITDAQVREIKTILQPLDYGISEQRVRQYAREMVDFNLADLKLFLNPAPPASNIGTLLLERTAKEIDAGRRWAEQKRHEQAQIDADYANATAGMSKAEVDALAIEVTRRYEESPAFRANLLKCGPDRSRTLRVLMLKSMGQMV